MTTQPQIAKNSSWFVEGDAVANVCTTLFIRERVPFKLEPVNDVPGEWWLFTTLADAPADCRPKIARDIAVPRFKPVIE